MTTLAPHPAAGDVSQPAMEKMQRQLATLVADVGRLKNNSNAGAGSSSDKLANVKCHKCGELGRPLGLPSGHPRETLMSGRNDRGGGDRRGVCRVMRCAPGRRPVGVA